MALSPFPGEDPGSRVRSAGGVAGALEGWFSPGAGVIPPRVARAPGLFLTAGITAYPGGAFLAAGLGIAAPAGRYFVSALFALSLALRPGMLLRPAAGLPAAFKAYLKFLPVVAAVALLGNLIFQEGVNPLLEECIGSGKPSAPLVLIGLAVFLGPLAEEACFRGLLYPALASRISPPAAAAVSAGVFAAFHGQPSSFLAIFALGIFLAGIYERTGSLRAPLLVHALHNALALLIFFLFRAVGE